MGGAGGHMRHPFDLERVQSGNDLIDIFNDLKSYAQQAAEEINVKIDGINVSFKLVGNEFAVDRGSQKPIDVEGVTLSRIGERFGEGHGMIPAITNLLTILNESIPMINPELKTLGLIDNPHYFLNTEYVMGATNAVGYSMNFIAIHGVNAFYEKYSRVPKKIAAQTGVSLIKARDGLPNPDNKKSYKTPHFNYLIIWISIYVQDKVIAGISGGHNAGITIYNKGKFIAIELERLFNHKNLAWCNFMPRMDGEYMTKIIKHYIKEKYGIDKIDVLRSINSYWENKQIGRFFNVDLIEHNQVRLDSEGNQIEGCSDTNETSGDGWAAFHHKSHAAGTFYQSPFDEALVFSFDGGGDD